MPKKLHYVVLALTKDKAVEVIHKLEEQGKDKQAEWLLKNKGIIYGDLPEDWRPFNSEKIKDIIAENSIYQSETHQISRLDEDCGNYLGLGLREVQIYFIDVFAMYIEKYKKLAMLFDAHFCNAEKNKCCFLINYALPHDIQEELEKTYKQTWPSVAVGYRDGSLHRIAVRIDDLKNFKNYVKSITAKELVEAPPHPKTYAIVGNNFLGDRSISNFRFWGH